jgi:hypothetical protein
VVLSASAVVHDAVSCLIQRVHLTASNLIKVDKFFNAFVSLFESTSTVRVVSIRVSELLDFSSQAVSCYSISSQTFRQIELKRVQCEQHIDFFE